MAGRSGFGSATSAAFNGLANGASYTYSVYATNAVGSSAPVAANAVPAESWVPERPEGVSAKAGEIDATVTWIPEVSSNGTAVTYQVESSGGTVTGVGRGISNDHRPGPGHAVHRDGLRRRCGRPQSGHTVLVHDASPADNHDDTTTPPPGGGGGGGGGGFGEDRYHGRSTAGKMSPRLCPVQEAL